jgi:hypothetical protein
MQSQPHVNAKNGGFQNNAMERTRRTPTQEPGDRMQEHHLENEITIQRPPHAVYGYVTQPWRWHEWHPASESATPSAHPLVAGDHFEEEVSMRPIAWLPWRKRSHLRWTVIHTESPLVWEVHGTSPAIDVRVRYQLAGDKGTRFRRTFHFTVKNWMRHVARSVVIPRMRAQSAEALQNLKRKLEEAVV